MHERSHPAFEGSSRECGPLVGDVVEVKAERHNDN
jgi:hypothetical protein